VSPAPIPEPVPDRGEVFERATGQRPRSSTRPETWAWIAFFLLGASVALLVYLGLRPGGKGPVLAYSAGRGLIKLAAVGTGFVGVLWSVLHRPLLRRRRSLAFLCLAIVIGTHFFPFPYPSSYEGHPSTTCFRLPGEGEWTVFWGGETKETSRLASNFPERRWGLDLIVIEDGCSHTGDGLYLEDYFVYGREVFAPADGRVQHVHSGLHDTQPGMMERGLEPYGNHVVLEIAPKEFLFLAHLKPGSIAVAEGEAVKRGQPIGRVGNSGYSTVTPEPHLAIHLQDTPVPRRGEAIPWFFCHYLADGRTIDRGLPQGGVGPEGSYRGQRISSLPD